MPCYSPLEAYRSRWPNASGKFPLVFDSKSPAANHNARLDIPCGKCIGCRLEKSRQWAVRCVHEASLHEENSFLTLTYSDEELFKVGGSLCPRHHTLFMKRLRKRIEPRRVSFFHCGEYGDETDRAHYHTILFGHDFPDKKFHKMSPSGDRLYKSEVLDDIWGHGHCLIGSVTFESAAYVARYVTKKLDGDKAEEKYQAVDAQTGEIVQIHPEYGRMSRNPAIGLNWYRQFKEETYPADDVVIRGRQMKPPKFYDKQLCEEELEEVKRARIRHARKHLEDETPERRQVREKVKLAQVSQLKRKL